MTGVVKETLYRRRGVVKMMQSATMRAKAVFLKSCNGVWEGVWGIFMWCMFFRFCICASVGVGKL